MRRLGVLTNPGAKSVAVETKLRRFAVLTWFKRFAVETRLRRLGVLTNPETLEIYPRVPNPVVVEVS